MAKKKSKEPTKPKVPKKRNPELAADLLLSIEKKQAEVDVKFNVWRDKKEELAQARKGYEEQVKELGDLIRDEPSTPLLDPQDDPADEGGD
jgi:hypothetical protein